METVKSIPEASLLLSSLRSVGYSEEAAIADLIDNCISAGADEISVVFDWENQRILLSDNGMGMDKDTLYENMRIGSSDPNKKREASDLGRFGMGMKTAAFSLGKRLNVITKKNGVLSNATWDLDAIPDIGWQLIIRDEDEIKNYANNIATSDGTVIAIEKLDRIIENGDDNKAKKHFFSIIRKVEKHIALVFHRYMAEDSIKIYINNNMVEPWDPFIVNNSATQELPEEYVWSEDTEAEVLIQPYVLPHKTKFPSDELFKQAGGPKGWNYHQGVYVYRNRRLIVCGTWFDYIKKEPAYNLARIKVDISSDNDSDWKIDIKKSTASLPIYAKEAMERAIDISTNASAKVYNSRGSYSKSNVTSPNLSYVWEQRKKNGKYSFHINRKHALLIDVMKKLDSEGKNALVAFIALIENFAPFMQSGLVESIQSSQTKGTTLEDDLDIEELKTYINLFETKGFEKEEIKSTLLEMPSYKHLKNEIIHLLED